jgi:hypothetical protein
MSQGPRKARGPFSCDELMLPMSVGVTAIRIVGVAVVPVVRVAVAAVIVIGAVVPARPVAKSADETPLVIKMPAEPSVVIEPR